MTSENEILDNKVKALGDDEVDEQSVKYDDENKEEKQQQKSDEDQ